jgi:hypothetical protein
MCKREKGINGEKSENYKRKENSGKENWHVVITSINGSGTDVRCTSASGFGRN